MSDIIVPVILVEAIAPVAGVLAPPTVLPTQVTVREFTFIWAPVGNNAVITVPQNTIRQDVLSIPSSSPYRYRVEDVDISVKTGSVIPTGSATPIGVVIAPFGDPGGVILPTFNTGFWGSGARAGAYPASTELNMHFARTQPVDFDHHARNFGWVSTATRSVLMHGPIPDLWVGPGGTVRVYAAPGVGANKDFSEYAVRVILTAVVEG